MGAAPAVSVTCEVAAARSSEAVTPALLPGEAPAAGATIPVLLTVMPALPEAHRASRVASRTDPSLYVAVATSCRDRPRGRLAAAGVRASWMAMAGVTVTTDLAAPTDALDDGQRTVVLRVIQEALQNVRKHAEASVVMVSTRLADDDWTVEIRDDGRGFDIGAAAARGRRNFGLQFMRERAEMIGARFDVRSQPNGGTVVRLAIPRGART